MKILLFGKNGQLGWELNRTLLCLGELIALDYPEVDFEKPKDVIKIIDEIKPDLIVNAAAYTDVDKAEIEKDKARLINAETPGEIATWCKINNSVLIHYSTDYVFDGTKGSPYTEEDEPNPINYYGKTKLEGEKAIQSSGGIYIILRTAWLYSMKGNNFVTKILEWSKKNKVLKIVDDQIGNPTPARMLAELTSDILAIGIYNLRDFANANLGIYNCASSGYCSRFEWARKIIGISGIDKINVIPAKTKDFINLARRPFFTALNCIKIKKRFNLLIPDWDKALYLYINKSLNNYMLLG